ncbi:hypothetical protein [Caulobacter sp. BP25]|uniref:hypothetical protein n=1 Tax=Caulobacter sp. BP25 TaxID=2048900 RepID=UPI000C12C1CE|nr:hypothetical protein [Caulobacter sp. BP25]PHY20921.1 hypothetical protein CSW59_06840 [Caulobacter sp. BP25]
MDDQNPAAANPADKILDNLDAFAGVVVQILTGGAYPLSSAQARQLLQAEGALKGSTAKVRELLDGSSDEDFSAAGFMEGFDGRSGVSEAVEERLIAHSQELSKYLTAFDATLRESVQTSLNLVGEAQGAQLKAADERFHLLEERFAAVEKALAASSTKTKGGKIVEPTLLDPPAAAPAADAAPEA